MNYDYIIVGAGSAGCVLATGSEKSSVLLLEAGPKDTDFWIHVPLGYGKLFTRTDINWAYESEPEPALNGRRIFTPRGKVLGGSSSINGLVYIRGQREDYDAWGCAAGISPRSSLISARRSAAQGVRSRAPRALRRLRRSARALGIPPNEDFNGATQEGTGYYRATTYRGRRRSGRGLS